MTFDEDNKVIIETMDITEASSFIRFLKSEILRHKQDIEQAKDLIFQVKDKFKLP